MSDVVEPMVREDQLPGHESQLEPKPDWEPRYKGSDRLKGKVAANRLHGSMAALLEAVDTFFKEMTPRQALLWAGIRGQEA